MSAGSEPVHKGWSLADQVRQRARFLDQLRQFFNRRGLYEVDTQLLSPHGAPDTHIDLFEVCLDAHHTGYLLSSPEYRIKQLLAQLPFDLYQIGHVYRRGERGRLHHPVFTLIEWYRQGLSFEQFIEEVGALVALFLGEHPIWKVSYRSLFLEQMGLDPWTVSHAELVEQARGRGLDLDLNLDLTVLLNEVWGVVIEPTLGQGESLALVVDYPPSEAALARIEEDGGRQVAKRFELYWRGVELGNGYFELNDSSELLQRLEEQNRQRAQLAKPTYPLDQAFIACVNNLPDCYGMALGFDRLLMLHGGLSSIEEVIPLGARV